MSQPYVGEIRLVGFNFEPNGWRFCDGSLLSIAQFSVLFNLIGTTYGGDGQQTFALPNLQGRVPVHQGDGFVIGQLAGTEGAVVTPNSLPPHTHTLVAANVYANQANPQGLYPGRLDGTKAYGSTLDTTLAPDAVNGGDTSSVHNNMQPYLVMNYVISLFGVYPSQN